MESNLEEFLANPYEFVESASVKDLVQIAKLADIAYYNNDEPIMSDDEYDLVRDRIKQLDPSNPYLTKPAHQAVELTQTITNKEKITLPYPMGSMNKFKPQDVDSIKLFKSSYPGPWIISEKLDGVSALYVLDPKEPPQLYTRGNGTIGTIITNLIPLISIAKPKVTTRTVVRGELIMSKKAFDKYSDQMANARNMVAGIVNAKTIDKSKAKDIDFVAYEMIEPWDTYQSQYTKLSKLKFNVVSHWVAQDIGVDSLVTKLSQVKSSSTYECDGIIISFNSPTKRVETGNPPYAFAFKNLAELETAIVKVIEVQWNISKDKYFKPKLIIEQTKLSGVTIQNVTAFNAKYVWDNCIGPGAEIKLVRSGDVIPHILEVTKPASSGSPQFPPESTYEWNETEVDIIAVSSSTQHRVKELAFFCEKLEIANLSEGNIKKMIDAGIDTIPAILSVTKAELAQVEGFKERMVDKIYKEIQSKLETMTLVQFMAGSNTFGHGMGERKIKKVLDVYPDIIYQYIEKKDSVLVTQLSQIDGFEQITSKQFVKGMGKFLELMNKLPAQVQNRLFTYVEPDEPKGVLLQGIKVVFSGFRDKNWEKIIVEQGGEVSTSVSKNTKMLVTTQEDINAKTNAKVLKAIELGIPVLSKEQFEAKYILKAK
jgi:NAD-dependent DNA ligase